MARFTKHIWACTLILSMELLVHVSINSAPVNSHHLSVKSMSNNLDEDEELAKHQYQFVKNHIDQDIVSHQKHKNNDNKQVGIGASHVYEKAGMEKIKNSLLRKRFNWHDEASVLKKALIARMRKDSALDSVVKKKASRRKDLKNSSVFKEGAHTETKKSINDRSMKKGISWKEEVISFGCLSFLFALTGGAALWLIIYTHLKREETRELDVAEKLDSFKPMDKREPKEPFPMFKEKEKEFKTLLHTVLKTERKKKRRKKRRGRSDSKLDLTRRGEIFAQKKKIDDLGFNTNSVEIGELSEQIVKFKNLLANGKFVREKMKNISRENQVHLNVDRT